MLGVTFKSLLNTTCGNVTTCTIGEYQAAAPTLSADRSCAACDGVTGYQDQAAQLQCKNVSTTCPAGYYQTQAATPSADRVCGSQCTLNSTYQAGNSLTCTADTVCPAGAQEVRYIQ